LDEVESMAEAAAGTQTAANERLLRSGHPTVAPYILAPLLRAWPVGAAPAPRDNRGPDGRLLDELVSGRLDAWCWPSLLVAPT